MIYVEPRDRSHYGLAPLEALTRREGQPSPVAVYLDGKPAMRGNLKLALRVLGVKVSVDDFPWESMQYEHVSKIRTELLAAGLAPAYARKCLVAVRGVLKVAWNMALIDTDTYMRAKNVDSIKGDAEPAGRMLLTSEVRRMLLGSPRDRAIIALAAYAGLRREEIAHLDLDTVITALNRGAAGLRVLGKGKKYRTVFLPTVAKNYLTAWIAMRGLTPGPFFWRSRRGGKLCPGRGLSPSGIWEIIARVARVAVVENLTPHDFRRTYASMLFDAGVDPVTVRDLMGHKNQTTTAGYDRRGDDRKIQAADALAKALGEDDPG